MSHFLRCTLFLYVLVFLGVSGTVDAASIKVLMAVGNNLGNPEDAPLEYAHLDAERMAKLFTEIGGVTADRARVLIDQPAHVVREQLHEMGGRIAELAAAGHEVVFLLYVSAHAKDGMLHLQGTQMPLSEIREFAQKTQARLRVLVIDACDSGAIHRKKGGAPGPEYKVELEKMPLAGQVVVSSSGPSEPSQEWDALRGSLFTHHLIAGLRGDADLEADGRVTLGEAYAYAYRRTVVDAVRSSQHPTFDFDVAGAGELVLTEPSAGKSAIVFPPSLEGNYVVASQPRPDVVMEVTKTQGKTIRLAIPPGNYLVKKRLGEMVGLMHIELPYGGKQEIDEKTMVKKRFTESAMKGNWVELRPSGLMLQTSAYSEPLDGTGMRFRFGAAYRRTLRELWWMVSVSYGFAQYRGVGLDTREHSGALSLSGGFRWWMAPMFLQAGVAVEGVGLRQSYVRDREEEIQRMLGTGPLPMRSAWGVSAGPVVGLEIPLTAQFFAWVEARGLVRYLPAVEQPSWTFGFQGLGALGWKF